MTYYRRTKSFQLWRTSCFCSSHVETPSPCGTGSPDAAPQAADPRRCLLALSRPPEQGLAGRMTQASSAVRPLQPAGQPDALRGVRRLSPTRRGGATSGRSSVACTARSTICCWAIASDDLLEGGRTPTNLGAVLFEEFRCPVRRAFT